MAKKTKMLMAAVVAVLLIAAAVAFLLNRGNGAGEQAASDAKSAAGSASSVSFDHIHGMGYAKNGSLIVPAHDGLRVYTEGTWEKPDSVPHDYMGFSVTDEGFYSSGHPAEGSDLPEPIGLVKSDALGTNVDPLVLQGEVDFHGMGAGYYSKAIYVYNPHPNSKMSELGLHYSLDEGATWTNSKASGIEGSIAAMAVHPDDAKSVAFGMDRGVFLSKDSGSTFEKVTDNPVTALAYTFDGKMIVAETSEMSVLDVTSLKAEALPIPELAEDEVVIFIAIHPENPGTIAYATSSNNMYESSDGGQSWTAIAEEGTGLNQK